MLHSIATFFGAGATFFGTGAIFFGAGATFLGPEPPFWSEPPVESDKAGQLDELNLILKKFISISNIQHWSSKSHYFCTVIVQHFYLPSSNNLIFCETLDQHLQIFSSPFYYNLIAYFLYCSNMLLPVLCLKSLCCRSHAQLVFLNGCCLSLKASSVHSPAIWRKSWQLCDGSVSFWYGSGPRMWRNSLRIRIQEELWYGSGSRQNDTDPDSKFSQFFIRIRIQENDTDSTDPDPQHWSWQCWNLFYE